MGPLLEQMDIFLENFDIIRNEPILVQVRYKFGSYVKNLLSVITLVNVKASEVTYNALESAFFFSAPELAKTLYH